MRNLELKVPPLIQVTVIGLTMFIASRFLPKVESGYFIQMMLAVTSIIVGIYFCLSGVIEFRRHKTTVDPRYPDNASELVDTGIYKISRNPMYVGFALSLVSTVFFLRSPILLLGFVVFVVYINKYQIMPEESHLSRAFGPKYDQYKRKVRRWL